MTEAVPAPSAHHHGSAAADPGARRLGLVLMLVLGYLVVEAIAGLLTNSLALLADAGHMFTDAVGIGLALLAIWFAQRAPPRRRSRSATTGSRSSPPSPTRSSCSASQRTSCMRRSSDWRHLPDVVGLPMLAVAVVGLVVNLVAMRMLHAGAQTSLNLRGAYLEVVGDLLGSVAVIVAAVVISLTGWTPIDPIASVVIAGLILPRTWTLLRGSGRRPAAGHATRREARAGPPARPARPRRG